MPLWPQFVSGAYRTRSAVIADEALINLYVETTDAASQPKKAVLMGTPGRLPLVTVGTVVCRGSFSQDGRSFTVVGDTLYELAGATAMSRGTIANDAAPVSFSTNGRGGEQVAIVGGGELKIFTLTTNTLSAAIALPLTYAPVMIDFIDGYFLLLEADTIRVWFSALEDGTSWDALDFFARSQVSDNLVAIKVLRDRIWTFGSLKTEVFYDSGDADNPFVPYPGSVMEEGLTSPWAVTILGESLIWMAQDADGAARVVQAADYAPQVVSTPAISFALASYPTLSDVEVLAYEQEGHPFAVFTCPSGDATWGYDAREQQWHERAAWDSSTGVFHRWPARGACVNSSGIVVGDRLTGVLSTLSLDTFTDNGLPIRRVRRAPYLSAENQIVAIYQLELGVENGVGLVSGQGSDPEIMLRVSRNSGKTWSNLVPASFGQIGEYGDRGPIWRRLGQAIAARWLIEVSMTDPVRAVWGPGAWLRAQPGTGQR